MIPHFTLAVLSRKIAFSTLVQYAGKIIQLILATLTIKMISGFLTESGFGVYSQITEYALFFSVVANLGIFGNVVRSMADDPGNGHFFLNALVFRIISALTFFVIGMITLMLTGGDSIFLIGAGVFFGSLLFDYVTSVCDAALQANYLMGRATIALVLGRVVNFFTTWLLINQFFLENSLLSIPWLLVGPLLGALLTMVLSVYFVISRIRLRWKISGSLMFNVLKVSLPFGIINIINSLYFRFLPDYFASAAMTEAQFATFNISFRIAQVVSLFSTFLMFSVLPGMREYIDEKHWQKVKHLYRNVAKILLSCGIVMVIFGSMLGPFLIELLTHKKYFLPEFWFVLPMMLLLSAISFGYDLVLITLFALNKDIWFLRRECLALALALILFSASVFVAELSLKIFLIVAGALFGEIFIVISGLLFVRKLLLAHK